jgi:mevalonate kinase
VQTPLSNPQRFNSKHFPSKHFPLKRLSFSVPGKIFLLGEYAALVGKPSIVATLSPRFELFYEGPCQEHTQELSQESCGASADAVFPFALHSPAGKLWRSVRKKDPSFCAQWLNGSGKWTWKDPFEGKGGFGASTAQFILMAAMLREMGQDERALSQDRWRELWKAYREQEPDVWPKPSGSDLVAQTQGGILSFSFEDEPRTQALEAAPKILENSLIFSATDQKGRKTATHQHLAALPRLSPSFIQDLESLVNEALQTYSKDDPTQFGALLQAYAKRLKKEGLEVLPAQEDRAWFQGFPWVKGVKGTGALLSDALVVVCDEGFLREDKVKAAEWIQRAERERKIQLIQKGIRFEKGLSTEGLDDASR